MSTRTAERRYTLEEFVEWAARQVGDEVYELLDGVPTVMAEAGFAHGQLLLNVGALVKRQLPPGCRATSGALVRLPGSPSSAYRPDIVIVCGTPPEGREPTPIDAPTLIVEVLSPSTGEFDRSRKLEDYQEIPSVQAVVFVSTDRRRVTSVRRVPEGWLVQHAIGNGTIKIPDPPLELPLDEVYGEVRL